MESTNVTRYLNELEPRKALCVFCELTAEHSRAVHQTHEEGTNSEVAENKNKIDP